MSINQAYQQVKRAEREAEREEARQENAEKIALYDQQVEWFTVRKGEFCVTWPKTCAHAPAVTTDVAKKSRKLIVKVLA